jgi:hypothetical protein
MTAELKKINKERYDLSEQDREWFLSRRVDGEVSPFSIAAFGTTRKDHKDAREVLKIEDHLFMHNGNFYLLGGIPEGGQPSNHLVGSKYICRLTNFPFSHPDEVDAQTKHRLKKHRGVPVGEFYGLGSKGFHIILEDEVGDIGLPLAASTYLIYSSI